MLRTRQKRHEYDTVTRTHFFDAWDARTPSRGVRHITHLPNVGITTPTGRSWLKLREEIGSKAYRSQRKTSSRLGRPPKVSALDLARLTDQKNPEHELHYVDQAKLLPRKPASSTLQKHTAAINARRYEKPFVSNVSEKNKPLRVQYGQEYEKETIRGFWEWIWFTDEAHYLSLKLQNKAEYELRIPGQERGHNVATESGLDVTIHVAAGISYNHKGPLIFYHDPAEPSEKQRKPQKPRRRKAETDEQFAGRLKVHKDEISKIPVPPKGNCMTQEFYAENILPLHIQQIQALEKRYGRRYRLQEDGDPSHGKRSQNNPAELLRQGADLLILVHPPQSPDLNPIEAIWMIVKKRLRGKKWSSVAQFKADLSAEWDKITLAQIRRRIREMPRRCKMVQESNGERIKSDVW